MSRKLVLHIGTHKTGTTAIQGAMAANVPALKAQGYAYPLFSSHFEGVPNDRNGYFIGRLVKDVVKPGSIEEDRLALAQTCSAELEKYLGAPEDVILSDERLWYSATGYGQYWTVLRSLMERYRLPGIRDNPVPAPPGPLCRSAVEPVREGRYAHDGIAAGIP